MAGQELPRPIWRHGALYRPLALLGTLLVVHSVVGKPPVHTRYALGGFLLWLVGVLLMQHNLKHFPFGPGAVKQAIEGTLELLRRPTWRISAFYRLLALLGASLVVYSVAGKPSVPAGHALGGHLLWLLGAVLMQQNLKRFPFGPGAAPAAPLA